MEYVKRQGWAPSPAVSTSSYAYPRECSPYNGGAMWDTNDRKLPDNWASIRDTILARDPRCRLGYPDVWVTAKGMTACSGRATEVDHIGDPNDHTPANLRGACKPCHRRRTEQQAKDAAKVQQSKSVHPAAHATHPALR